MNAGNRYVFAIGPYHHANKNNEENQREYDLTSGKHVTNIRKMRLF